MRSPHATYRRSFADSPPDVLQNLQGRLQRQDQVALRMTDRATSQALAHQGAVRPMDRVEMQHAFLAMDASTPQDDVVRALERAIEAIPASPDQKNKAALLVLAARTLPLVTDADKRSELRGGIASAEEEAKLPPDMMQLAERMIVRTERSRNNARQSQV